jgi:flagellar biosynthesis/type III secretory pathway M-ring protein FliF/YscJ
MTDALTQIRSAVKASTGLADENSVNVAVYTDTMTVLGEAAQAGSAGAITDLVGGFGRELAVGALALVSLGMVTMLARKGGGPAGAGGEAAGGATGATGAAGLAAALGGGGGGYKDPPQHLPGGDDVVGIVPAANPFLSAVELDEDTVQTQQMQEQVASMVKEDPDAAAGMIKRWMNRQ